MSPFLGRLGKSTNTQFLIGQQGIDKRRFADTGLPDKNAGLAFQMVFKVIKAIAGGGGRGMRVVREAQEVAQAYARAASEANAAFGSPAVYAEQFVGNARHIEVQILGDGSGAVSHLWERECSAQHCVEPFTRLGAHRENGQPAHLR